VRAAREAADGEARAAQEERRRRAHAAHLALGGLEVPDLRARRRRGRHGDQARAPRRPAHLQELRSEDAPHPRGPGPAAKALRRKCGRRRVEPRTERIRPVNVLKPGAPPRSPVTTPSTPASGKTTTATPEEPAVSQPVTPRLETPSAREARMKQLGLSEKMVEHGGKARPASKIFETLGSRMEPVKLVNVPGRVMWVDFDLARELGFNVPKDNRMTPEFHQELLQALSYRVLKDGEDPAGKTVVQGGADRYQGTGMGGATGAGRAAFLPALNVNIKGAGRTPLASAPSGTDFTHSHGGAPAREGLLEAIWGLEADNLFANKGTRILAVIDSGDA